MTRHPTTRRRFLQATAASAALGALPITGVLRSARAAVSGRTLVAIHLTGGCDTLNTVIPYADPAYARIRGALAIPRANVLRLDDRSGLHPALRTLQREWNRRRLAVVHGVGYPSFDYSHFQAMEIYWSADPRRALFTGWLGRAVDTIVATEAAPDALTAAAVGGGTPPSLIAQRFTAPQLPNEPQWFNLQARDDAQAAAVRRVLQQPLTRTNYLYDGFLRNSNAALRAYDTVKRAASLAPPVKYPDNGFSQGLDFTARLLRTDDAIRVVTLEQGSYDTHENQLEQHARSLAELDGGLRAFIDDLDANGLSNRVAILLWTEFARRVEPNASKGTDHGSAQAMLLIGAGVRGGILGRPPSLAPADLVDDGNLPMQHDFRSVYAALLGGWLGVDPDPLLGGTYTPLPLLY